MSDGRTPDLSVVIVTPDGYETIRQTMKHLRAQTVGDRVEVMIAAPLADRLGLNPSDLDGFFRVGVVEVGEIDSTAKARAAAIRQASAPIVALAESHSFPAPGWAEALINAHQRSWAAVGPEIHNGNPKSMISWADVFLNSSRWLAPAEATVIDDLQGRNAAYKRALLLDYGSDLEAMLEAEVIMHWDLHARGYQLYLEPAAKTYHLNFTRLPLLIREQFYGSWLFGASRSRRWSWPRRWLYLSGTPLVPVLRLWRMMRELSRPGRPLTRFLQTLPVVMVGLVAGAVGELMGYACGLKQSSRKVGVIEFRH
jgi:hypothetical protein